MTSHKMIKKACLLIPGILVDLIIHAQSAENRIDRVVL